MSSNPSGGNRIINIQKDDVASGSGVVLSNEAGNSPAGKKSTTPPPINIERQSAANRVVPMDDLNLLVDQTKARTDSPLLNTSALSEPLTLPKEQGAPHAPIPAPSPAPAVVTDAALPTSTSNTPPILMGTTDLSDILGNSSQALPPLSTIDPILNNPDMEVINTTSLSLDPPSSGGRNIANTSGSAAGGASGSAAGGASGSAAGGASGSAAGGASGSAGGASGGSGSGGGFFSFLTGGKKDAPKDAPKKTAAPSTSTTAASTAAGSGAATAAVPTGWEAQREKQNLLFRLERLAQRGLPLTRKYTMSSSLEDIRQEYNRLKAQRSVQNSIKFQRKMLMACVTGIEFLNSRFDPFDAKLDGWSESVHENVDEYDEIFEELHEKYKSKGKMAPEMKLLMSLTGSAFMFHLTQSLFKTSMPAVGDVMRQNPDLMRQFASATVGSMAENNPDIGSGLGSFMTDAMGMGGGGGRARDSDARSVSSQSSNSSVERRDMQGPTGVDHILSSLSLGGPPGAAGGAAQSRIESMTTASAGDMRSLRQPDGAAAGSTTGSSGGGMKLNI